MFADGSNTQFIVKSKGFGKTAGKAMDQFKGEVYEGEVLFTPGTKFKVSSVREAKVPKTLEVNPDAALNNQDFKVEILRSDPEAVAYRGVRFGALQKALLSNDQDSLKVIDPDYNSGDSGFSKAFRREAYKSLKPKSERAISSEELFDTALVKTGLGDSILSFVKGAKPELAEAIDRVASSGLTGSMLKSAIENGRLQGVLDVRIYDQKLIVSKEFVKEINELARTVVSLEEL